MLISQIMVLAQAYKALHVSMSCACSCSRVLCEDTEPTGSILSLSSATARSQTYCLILGPRPSAPQPTISGPAPALLLAHQSQESSSGAWLELNSAQSLLKSGGGAWSCVISHGLLLGPSVFIWEMAY